MRSLALALVLLASPLLAQSRLVVKSAVKKPVAAPAPPDPKLLDVAKSYIQFGSHPDYPHDADCVKWAHLYQPNGIRNTPGIPPSQGWEQLTQMCLTVRAQFETLLDTYHEIIPVRSWNNELRAAIQWDLVGTTTSGEVIKASVITAIFAGQNYTIQTSWDFLPPLQQLTHKHRQAGMLGETLHEQTGANSVNLTEIARLYMTFGSPPGDVHTYDCNKWAALFTVNGTRNTPGQPPSQGFSKLVQMCQLVRSQFSELFPYEEMIIPVTSWNNEKRVAFTWTIAGIDAATGKSVSVPAISTLFTDQNGLIETSWDFLDPSGL